MSDLRTLLLVCLLAQCALNGRRADTGETTAGWRKSPSNPVLGGKLGTCFDVSVIKDGEGFRMWFSWRPKHSIALSESRDGVRWSKPTIVLRPNRASGWEQKVNRPVVLKTPGGYHIWYTGQTPSRSCIGYATSRDGRTWTRRSAKPVLSPEAPWEKVAVMCPHVLWDEPAGLYRMWYSGGEQIGLAIHEGNALGFGRAGPAVERAEPPDRKPPQR